MIYQYYIKMSKKNNNISIIEQLKEIDKNIYDLSKMKNIDQIFKKYSETQIKINNADNTLYKLKLYFDKISNNTKNSKELKKIVFDEKNYENFIKEIENDINTLEKENDDIEIQIEKYKNIMDKLLLCEKYFQSLQLNIIKCDDKNDDDKNDDDKNDDDENDDDENDDNDDDDNNDNNDDDNKKDSDNDNTSE